MAQAFNVLVTESKDAMARAALPGSTPTCRSGAAIIMWTNFLVLLTFGRGPQA